MATIATRSFGDGTSTLATLFNEEFVRTLDFQNGWSKIRIGMLCAIQTGGSFTMPSPNGFGICTGNATIQNTLGYRSVTTTNWVGAQSCQTTIPFTFNAGPPAYTSTSTIYSAAKRQNTIYSTTGNATAAFYAVAGSGDRGFWFVDITKLAAASMTIKSLIPLSAAVAQSNYTMADLLYGCEQVRNVTAIMKGTSISYHPDSGSNAGDENTGPLDTLSIVWQAPATPLEVYGVAAAAAF